VRKPQLYVNGELKQEFAGDPVEQDRRLADAIDQFEQPTELQR
jgi:hypothetical protein